MVLSKITSASKLAMAVLVTGSLCIFDVHASDLDEFFTVGKKDPTRAMHGSKPQVIMSLKAVKAARKKLSSPEAAAGSVDSLEGETETPGFVTTGTPEPITTPETPEGYNVDQETHGAEPVRAEGETSPVIVTDVSSPRNIKPEIEGMLRSYQTIMRMPGNIKPVIMPGNTLNIMPERDIPGDSTESDSLSTKEE
jgi:hypothetical protein